MKKHTQLAILIAMAATGSAQATVWTQTINSAGRTGTITFDDWGYTGPNGRTAADFDAINGFGNNALDPTGGIGQIQRVVTLGPDGLTTDAANDIRIDGGAPLQFYYSDANMDSATNFFQWGYTSPAGSTFNNMMIDYDGDYHIAKDDMQFAYYDNFQYQDTTGLSTGLFSEGTYETNYQFQPYAMSDAKGWCGSVMTDNPAGLEAMAGQVTFDFGFDVWTAYGDSPLTAQYVPDFEMRSYGSLTIDFPLVGDASGTQYFQADAVVNNTNPLTGSIDPGTGDKSVGGGGVDADFYNLVSFMGGGIVPDGVWVDANGDIIRDENGDLFAMPVDTTNWQGEEPVAGAKWHNNSFKGYAFLLRADGIRIIESMDYSLYGTEGAQYTDVDGNVYNYDQNGNEVIVTNLSAVPVPAAVWLFGSGLIALLGFAKRRRAL